MGMVWHICSLEAGKNIEQNTPSTHLFHYIKTGTVMFTWYWPIRLRSNRDLKQKIQKSQNTFFSFNKLTRSLQMRLRSIKEFLLKSTETLSSCVCSETYQKVWHLLHLNNWNLWQNKKYMLDSLLWDFHQALLLSKEYCPDIFIDLYQAHIVEIRMSVEIWIRGARLPSYGANTGEWHWSQKLFKKRRKFSCKFKCFIMFDNPYGFLCFFWYFQKNQNGHNCNRNVQLNIIYSLKTYLLGCGWCRMYPQPLEMADGGGPAQMNWKNMSEWHRQPTENICITVVQIRTIN